MTLRVLESTPCASAVLAYFGVTGVTWNNRTKRNVWADTLRRAGYAVRSRNSKLRRNERTVGAARARLAAIADAEPEIRAFVVCVEGHVLVLDRDGSTVVDTAPRTRDRRYVYKVYAII